VGTDKEGRELPLIEILDSGEEDLAEKVHRRQQAQALHIAVEHSLDPRERHVVEARYGLSGEEPLTQKEVAGELGISRSYVSRIEKKALGRLQDAMAGGEAEKTQTDPKEDKETDHE